MLTIPTMVRVGPWTLKELTKSSRWTNCERCDRRIKEVWTCTVDPASKDLLSRLNGQLIWRVGSTCGPTLIEVSEEKWKEQTSGTRRRMRLLEKVEMLIIRAAEEDIELPAVIYERRALLKSGVGTDSQLRNLSLVVGSWVRKLEV